ncbi:hypothetical protein OQA88_5878 [Cercophora sp. LCS_1]
MANLLGTVERFPQSKMSLLDVLMNHRSCEASDPRDKVFIFTSLATAPGQGRIGPDYTVDVRATYKRVAEEWRISRSELSPPQIPAGSTPLSCPNSPRSESRSQSPPPSLYPTGLESRFSATIKTLCALRGVGPSSSSGNLPLHSFNTVLRIGHFASFLDKLSFRRFPVLHGIALRILEKVIGKLPTIVGDDGDNPDLAHMLHEEIARFLSLLTQGLNFQSVFRTRTGYVGMTSS